VPFFSLFAPSCGKLFEPQSTRIRLSFFCSPSFRRNGPTAGFSIPLASGRGGHRRAAVVDEGQLSRHYTTILNSCKLFLLFLRAGQAQLGAGSRLTAAQIVCAERRRVCTKGTDRRRNSLRRLDLGISGQGPRGTAKYQDPQKNPPGHAFIRIARDGGLMAWHNG
jgi:hypothetical protein